MSETAPETPVTQVTTEVNAAPLAVAAPLPPRSPKEAVAALLEPQFLLSLVMMLLVARIIDSLLRSGTEGMQSQILMVATTILGFIGGAYFGANLAKASSGSTPSVTTKTTTP